MLTPAPNSGLRDDDERRIAVMNPPICGIKAEFGHSHANTVQCAFHGYDCNNQRLSNGIPRIQR